MNDINFSNRVIIQMCNFQNTHNVNNMEAGLPNHAIGYIISGHCKMVTKTNTLNLGPDSLFLIPKGTCYKSFWTGNPDISHKVLRFNNFPTYIASGFEIQTLSCTEEVKQKFRDIPTDRDDIYVALSRFYDALGSVIPFIQNSNLNRDDIILDASQKYIYSHPTCTIPEIAEYFSISVSYLYNIYKRKMGVTPNDYRLSVCCETAVTMLTTTNKTVEEISRILNFSSGSYMRKVLAKYTGQTPREIRKNSTI